MERRHRAFLRCLVLDLFDLSDQTILVSKSHAAAALRLQVAAIRPKRLNDGP